MCPKNSGETSWTYRDISYYLVGGLTHNVCTFVVPRLCISALISSVIFKKKEKKIALFVFCFFCGIFAFIGKWNNDNGKESGERLEPRDFHLAMWHVAPISSVVFLHFHEFNIFSSLFGKFGLLHFIYKL